MSGTPEGLCTACSATQYCAEHDPNAAAAPARACREPAPDRSGRQCDKVEGHEGDHWTYGGNTLTWPRAAAARAPEGLDEQVARLEMMVEDDGETWDLSPNDKAAIAAVLDALRARPALSDEVLSGMARHRCREYAEKFTQQDLVEFARAVLARQQGTR